MSACPTCNGSRLIDTTLAKYAGLMRPNPYTDDTDCPTCFIQRPYKRQGMDLLALMNSLRRPSRWMPWAQTLYSETRAKAMRPVALT